MPDNPQHLTVRLGDQTRDRLTRELQLQARQLEKLEEVLVEVRHQHERLEASVREQIETLIASQPDSAESGPGDSGSLQNLLDAISALKTLTQFTQEQFARIKATAAAGSESVAGVEPGAEGPVLVKTSSEDTGIQEETTATEDIAQGESSPAMSELLPVTLEPASPSEVTPATPVTDISQLSEVDRKIHQDARRFARLLVSEIELYNKLKVSEGRKSKDLYRRLKSDIDRSRLTYEKRFGKTVARQFDYFHDEVVKILSENEPSSLGPDYPGPSV